MLSQKKNEFIRDSAIQRFEIAFELAWKTVKVFVAEEHNAVCSSPRDCFRQAFRLGLVVYDDAWIEMTKLRDYTVHTYDEALAEKIYAQLPMVVAKLTELREALKSKREGEDESL